MINRNPNKIIENESAYEDAIARRIKANAALTRSRAFEAAHPDAEAILNYIHSQYNAFWQDVSNNVREYGAPRPRIVEIVRERLAGQAAKKAEFTARDARSQHVGEVGQRIEFEAVCTFVYHGENAFGAFTITGLRDDNDNVYIYKGTAAYPEKGERWQVRATVKEHSERDGVKQTKISRPKFIKM